MSLLIKHGVGTGRISLHLGQSAQGLPLQCWVLAPVQKTLGSGYSPGETSQVLQGSRALEQHMCPHFRKAEAGALG